MFQGPSPAELRRTENGELVTLFDHPLHDGDFSVDSTYFVARFRDGTNELWNFRAASRLTRLGLSLGSGAIGGEDEGYHFDMDSKRLIVWYTNGQVYLLDINWLEMMTTAASSDDLIRVACWPFKSTNFFDEAALKPYLENTPLQACRP